MVTGSSLLVQIQIAFIGIVVVLGTFYIWRMISRLEERVEKLALNCSCGPRSQSQFDGSCSFNTANKSSIPKTSSLYPEEDEYAEEMMRVFGNMSDTDLQSKFIIPVRNVDNELETTTSGVVLTQYNDDDDEQFEEYFAQSRQRQQQKEEEGEREREQEHSASDAEPNTATGVSAVLESSEADNFSEAETDTENPLSKSKLKRMSADKLKELCKDRSLPVDGSKALLIDRILGITRN